ncbi:MAG: hypothetical protein HYV63_20660 [Candidatus Schekmanbacteria bacterium]|nr:hypothetical protein [Candidatus Schekmanbacteria bacterium]
MQRIQDYAFYGLLGLFLAVSIGIFVFELRGHPRPHATAEAAAVPHSPAEFPDVFNVDPLEGLTGTEKELQVPPPPLNPDYWPCTDCHDPQDDNAERRELSDEHTDIVLHHGDEKRWCLDCHSFENRTKLRLASGEPVSFTKSYELCGQCHGTIFRDWKAGIHGRRTGYWNGPKRYLLCVHCHWPHAPRFKQMVPLPPPARPETVGRGLFATAHAVPKSDEASSNAGVAK